MDHKLQLLKNPALHLGKSVFRGRLDAENYVDMGLPSGTKWAASNLDVKSETGLAASPFQYECSFFSWGNIIGHNPVNEHSFEYDYGHINESEPWYEGQPYGDTPGSTLAGDIPVDEEFDAARAKLGSPWRMPTSAEFDELIAGSIYIDTDGVEIPDATTDKRVTVNDIVGLYLQSRTNGNRLFFAASGYGAGSTWYGRGSYGYYWSRSFGSSRLARRLDFLSGGVHPQGADDRYIGFAVRPVMK